MADTVENLNALAKEVFGSDGVKDLIPNQNKIQQKLTFSNKKAYGLKYVETIRLGYPSGFTHQAADGTGGAFALNDATSGTRKRIEVQGEQILLKDQFSYEDGARIAKGGKQAFASFQNEMFEPMQRSMRKRLETQLLYGQVGIGVVQTYTGGDPSVVIKESDWAEGIWAGMEGAALDFYQGTTGTQRGTTVTVVAVDLEARKLTLSGTVASLAANDTIYWAGAKDEEMAGVHKILANTGALFGVNATTYSLWKGSEQAVGGGFTFAKLKNGITRAFNLGLDDKLCLFISPESWDNLIDTVESLRTTTGGSDIKKLNIGTEKLEYHSQNGVTEVIASNFVKKSYGYGLCLKDWKRIGAADVSFNTPGMESEKLFHHLETKAGIEVRSYTNQAVFTRRPAASILFKTIA